MRLALPFLLMVTQFAHAEPLLVGAAADLTYCLPEIDAAFEKANPGAEVKISYGSSGNLYAEIKNGAPFDVFLSADRKYPDALIKAGLASDATEYAEGRIVLWTTNPGIDVTRGLAVLTDAAVKRVAIAHPGHAPYGRAAEAALKHEHLWDTLAGKLVLGENIAQAAQFVQTGNADAGIVAMSLVVAPEQAGKGRYFVIPAEDYPAISQAAMLTKGGEEKAVGKAYVAFLKTDEARKILERFGFALPK